jgi:hypothetical protein
VLAGRSFSVEKRIFYLETQSLINTSINLSIKARVMLEGYTE